MITSSNTFERKATLAIEASKRKDRVIFRKSPKLDGKVECPTQVAGGLR